ncbi:MAG: peptide ABC transporter substrate-binding protein [Candidatus Wolfebacteria bacterium]|nr:peptide ABC transporter substrate-binding protein [Candidatus Wolfebacteria bacterium]
MLLGNSFKILKSFSKKERIIFLAGFLVFIFSAFFLVADYIGRNTVSIPVRGGEYREGIVGQPSFINPALIGSNDADRDLSEIIFSGVLDLADNYKMSPDGKTWTIRLKDNVVWDDGQPITSDDIIFSINTIQDPDSRSSLSALWQGISTQRVSEREFKLILPSPYAFFEKTLKNLRPIPKHIFGALPAGNLRLSEYNLEPVGSGPFKYSSFEKRKDGFITSYYLVPNNLYLGDKPYLSQLTFKFYEDEHGLTGAVNNGAVDGAGFSGAFDLGKISVSHNVYDIRMPKYYAVFMNQYANQVLGDINVRLAMGYAINRSELSKKVFGNHALPVLGPMVPGMDGYMAQIYPQEDFSQDKAANILDSSGWKMRDSGIREKNSYQPAQGKTPATQTAIPLEVHLTVPDTKFLIDAANILRDDWAKIGIKTDVEVVSSEDINNKVIKGRDYEMLLFGNIFGDNPDLFSFWHSSEKFYPGLNLSLYDNRVADGLMESIRKNLDEKSRDNDLASLQSIIINDEPAIFLFSPSYLYVAKVWLHGFDDKFISLASDRFLNIGKWYVKTALVFK